MPDVAEKIGKTEAAIQRRLKLLNLTEKAQKAYRAGQIGHRAAAVIAKMPSADDQHKLLKSALNEREFGRDSRLDEDAIALMYPLAGAPFHRGEAIAGKVPCDKCPNRTGAQPSLFEAADKNDRCLDGACFRAKTEAHTQRILAEAKKEGIQTLGEKQAAKLFDFGRSAV